MLVFLRHISHSVTSLTSIQVVTNGKISFFLWLKNIPFDMHTPDFLYSFIYQWTFRLNPCLFFLSFCLYVFSRTAPVAYGDSQDRG